MADIDIQITDNSGEILRELENKKAAALEAVGISAEAFAKLYSIPVRTGRLRNSISHAVKGDDVYIGSNLYYAPFVELGTGIHASDGQGRKSPWAYQDSKGVWHNTIGIKPRHMLKKAASEHTEEYKRIIENQMKG